MRSTSVGRKRGKKIPQAIILFRDTSRRSFAGYASVVARCYRNINSHFKGTPVREDTEFRESFTLTKNDPADFGMQAVRFVCYRGSQPAPEWTDQDPCKFLSIIMSFSS